MIKTLTRTLIGATFLLLCSQASVNAQCQGTTLDITTNVSSGDRCASNTEELSVNNAPQYDQIRWNWGDGSQRTSANSSESYNYTSPGDYTPSVEFLDANGDVICEVTADQAITIFKGPNADFEVLTQNIQCFTNNEFDFEDQSTEGDAPITDWNWTFGDGNNSNAQNPTHSYAQGGEYPIVLQVTDDNGCTDFKEVDVDENDRIEVTKDINPGFNTVYDTRNGNPTCPETPVIFRNTTPDQGRIDDYTFAPGDGSGNESLSVPWNSTTHTYKKDGTFTPTLTVTDTNDCEATFSSQVENIDFDFDKSVIIGDSVKCLNANTFNFSHSPRNRAEEYTWNFGHQQPPNPEELNIWTGSHSYGGNLLPGVFDVSLEIVESRDCVKDTTYEAAVGIEGPSANIEHPLPEMIAPPNTYLGPEDKVITREEFKEINRSECGIDSVQYLLNPDTSEDPKTWKRGDPIPGDTVYGPESGTFNYQNPHDTDIFHPECEAPNLVRFTNNTIKLRLERDSNGDYKDPLNWVQREDDMTRPVTPQQFLPSPGGEWASDSLEYTWRFQDPSAPGCTTLYDWQSKKVGALYDQSFTKIRFGPDDTVFIDSSNTVFDSVDADHMYIYDKSGDSVVFEQGVDFEAFVDTGADDSASADQLFLEWNISLPNAPGGDSLLVEYFMVDSTRSSAKCNFSKATTPYHLFDTTMCFGVQLEAYDSVTDCRDQATLQIFTTAPDAGWEEEFYEEEESLTYGYNNEDSLVFDSLMEWTSTFNGKEPDSLLATKVLKDREFTVLGDFSGSTFQINPSSYEIINRDLAWIKFNTKPKNPLPGNNDAPDSLIFTYYKKNPEIIGGDTLNLDKMTYSLQNQLSAKYGSDNGPRRGVRLEGAKCEGATQTIQRLEGTFPASQCGSYGKDFGFVQDRENMRDTITCTDSVDTNNDGVWDDTVERDQEVASWVPGPDVVEHPMAWNWEFEYDTAGCKTVGLWTQTGDCYDTFWYEDYKFIADNDPDHRVLNFDTEEPYTGGEISRGFCLGKIGVDSFPLLAKPRLTNQQDIVNFQITIEGLGDQYGGNTGGNNSFEFEVGTDSIVDTIYQFCTDSIVEEPDGMGGTINVCSENLINFPERTCGKSATEGMSLQNMINSDNYNIYDTMYVINLKDTVEMAIKKPGVYQRRSKVSNAQDCTNDRIYDQPMYVGHFNPYEPYVPDQDNDSTICIGDTVYFTKTQKRPYYIEHHLPTYYDRHEVVPGTDRFGNLSEEGYFRDPTQDGDRPEPPGGYEKVEYDLDGDGYYETKYDIDTLLFTQDRDKDGSYETLLKPRDVDNDGAVDTVPYFVYDESGTYDVSLKSTDSTGCAQIREKEEKIIVTDIEAYAGLDKVPGVCAPQTINFKDSSVVFNAYRYEYDSAGNVVDSTKVDSTASWEWTFDDHREETPTIKNPQYVFTRNGSFTPTFIATTATGCSDTSNKIIQPTPEPGDPNDTVGEIDLLGPKPGFVIQNPEGCEPHTARFRDTSERVDQWTFFRGDGDQDNFDERPEDSIFDIDYDTAGIYYATLLAEATVPNTATADDDSIACSIVYPDTTEIGGQPLEEYDGVRVQVNPTNEVNFTVENAPLCPGDQLIVSHDSDSRYDSFDFAMGNGDTVTKYTNIDSTEVPYGDTTVFSTDTTVSVMEGDSVLASDTTFEADGGFDFAFSTGDTLITTFYEESRVASETFEYDYDVNADSSFTIRLIPMGHDSLCYDTMEKTIQTGGLVADLDTLPSRAPIFRFTNNSEYGDEYEWFFPDGTIQDSVTADNWDEIVESDPGRPAGDLSDETKERGNYNNGVLETTDAELEPELDYRSDKGDYDVCILARRNDFGCAEVKCMTINNPFDTSFTRANVLTPNGDGNNDRLQFELEGAVDFSLTIYNRWGDVVYETEQGQSNYRCEEAGSRTRRCHFWNGQKNNTGNDSPAGTYYYSLEYQLRDGQSEQKSGVITLIR